VLSQIQGQNEKNDTDNSISNNGFDFSFQMNLPYQATIQRLDLIVSQGLSMH